MRKKKKSKLIKCENNKYIYVYNDWETLGSVKRILSSSEKEAKDKKEADDIKKYEYLEKLRKEGTLTSAVKYYILAYVIETYTLSEIIPYRNRCEKRICDNIGYLKADLITSAQVNDYLSGITHLYNDSGLKSIAACIKESVRCMTDRELDITVPKSRLNNRYILSNEEKKDFEKYCISINNIEEKTLLFSLYTGIKIADIINLAWKDYKCNSVTVNKKIIQLDKKSRDLISQLKQENQEKIFVRDGLLSDSYYYTLGRHLRNIINYTGIPDAVNFLSLRNTKIIEMYNKGLPFTQINNSIGFNFDRERQEIYKAKKYIENIVESNRIYEERKKDI